MAGSTGWLKRYSLNTIDAKTQTRESSETGFLQLALRQGNLIVYQSALAKRILFGGNKTATGVLVETRGSQYTISAKREVILSAGVFGSPQMLMVSGIGPAASRQNTIFQSYQTSPMWAEICA